MTLKLLAVASECTPFVKTGGLADVVSALCPALAAEGVACRVLLPLYRQIAPLAAGAKEVWAARQRFGGPVRVLATRAAGIDLLLIDAPHLYDRAGGPYLDEAGRDWEDNHLRFGLLSRLGAEIGRHGLAGWKPELVHAHDWQAGLTPVYAGGGGGTSPPTVLTIHNVAFQGLFPAGAIAALGLDPTGFHREGYEFHGQIGFLKGGLMAADRITTVSPTYARELLTPEFGMGLEGVLAARRDAFEGILNGIDLDVWNPSSDPALAQTYSSRALARKAANKAALLAHFSMSAKTGAPLFSVISRLSSQKGLDLALEVLPDVLETGAGFVLLGSGDPDLEAGFRSLAARFPGQVGVHIGFDEDLAHLTQAGADATLVPSRFEPCGLTQLCALRYGTLPIVARTGGLADTVIDANAAALAAGCATGFHCAAGSADSLAAALARATEVYRDTPVWRQMQRNAMKHPVGWGMSARRLAALYRELVARSA